MNNRRTVPGAGVTHMLSTILAKVNNIEKLLSPSVENIPDSEILDSKGVRLLTKMSDRTLLRRRNDGTLPYYRDKGKSTIAVRMYCVPYYWKKQKTLKNKRYEKDD